MDTMDRRIIIAAGALTLLLIVVSFFIGRATASTVTVDEPDQTTTTELLTASSDDPTDDRTDADGTTTTTLLEEIPYEEVDGDPSAALAVEPTDPSAIPPYGTDEEREVYVRDLAESGFAWTSRSAILSAADHVCHNLTRLEELRRSPAFAVRVVWNESLMELDESDLRAWSVIWRTAPSYLCTHTIGYAEEVSYWLGF